MILIQDVVNTEHLNGDYTSVRDITRRNGHAKLIPPRSTNASAAQLCGELANTAQDPVAVIPNIGIPPTLDRLAFFCPAAPGADVVIMGAGETGELVIDFKEAELGVFEMDIEFFRPGAAASLAGGCARFLPVSIACV